jgi:hypothetical protein
MDAQEHVETPRSTFRESRPPKKFLDYMTLIRSKGKLVVSSRWLYKINHATYGSIDKFKVRFVVRGFSQRERGDYEDTFSPVSRYKK